MLDETLTLLARRASYHFAAQRATGWLSSDVLEILRPGPDDELTALTAFERFADQRISYTDCVSFVLMRRHGLRFAFAFDRHFTFAGFELWPPLAGMVNEPVTEYGV